MTQAIFIELMRQLNEAITAATVIVAASMLTYNLTRGFKDRATRVSSGLLGCVTAIYIGDVFVSLSRYPNSIETWLRLEWIGMAFAPTVLFHLSDVLLETTGLLSRGRRRRIVRILYGYSVTFLIAATLTDLIAHGLTVDPMPMMQAGPLFPAYTLFFILTVGFAFNNVLRARRRCLTTATHRRMSYLLFALITPVIGIFPFSLLFNQPSSDQSAFLWLLINISNISIILMLVFMSYPLAFFGINKPDRVIKAELLSFTLRGPVLGIAVLMVILYVPRLQGLGFPAVELTPFFAVATILLLQWMYTYVVPFLERRLIYTDDQEQAREIRALSESLMTPADARQLLEAILASICDYLRVRDAFVASSNGELLRLEQKIGSSTIVSTALADLKLEMLPPLSASANGTAATTPPILTRDSHWLIPLYSTRGNGHSGKVIGVLGLQARAAQVDLDADEELVFGLLYRRVARLIDDMQLQEEVFARLEDVIAETEDAGQVPEALRKGYASGIRQLTRGVVENDDFPDLIKDALRDYWGGPRLTDERLLKLSIVTQALKENENNPAKAVRAILGKAIERLKPEGARNLTATEWTLYNILDMRFVQGRKVRDVAPQLAMSEADLYRKQKIAIGRVAEEIADMERQAAPPTPAVT
ncbi:MAG: hypothetical protein KF726_26610 [Anaerolineae bacterium]|nr:hypothetical protein [Anaerolineae bacterium]